jgi:hypothetical protein
MPLLDGHNHQSRFHNPAKHFMWIFLADIFNKTQMQSTLKQGHKVFMESGCFE